MVQNILKIVTVFLLVISLEAKDIGLSQTHLISISKTLPIEVKFDLPIDKHSINSKSIVLKDAHRKKIKGSTKRVDLDTLVFYNEDELMSGTYELNVKKLYLLDYNKNTRFQKSAKKMCSYFYDDVTECRLYRYASRVKTKKIKYDFELEDNQAKLVALTLSKENLQINIDKSSDINVTATYDDNTSSDITKEVQWSMSDSSVLSLTDNIITPLNEGSTTLQATYNNVKSTLINVTVYKEINGYKLPPEPNETLNNSTLLGIDVNDNGVRDDVERLIIIEESKNNEYPKTQIAIAFQYASAWQNMIENPIMESREYLEKASSCQWYWFSQKLKDTRGFLTRNQWRDQHSGQLGIRLTNKIFNTKERILQRFEFNQACSGQIFDRKDKGLDDCQINLDELGE